jgi:SAM-dependent methyltransferase
VSESVTQRGERTLLVHVRDTVEWYLRKTWLGKHRRRMIFVKTKCGLEPIRNYLIDRRYGGWLGGTYDGSYEHIGMYGLSSTDYSMLPKLFNELDGTSIGAEDVLVDVGCGRGRVLNWWLSLELGNRIVGIELEPRWAEETRARLAGYPDVTVIQGDVLESLPPDGTIFYLFNPFGAGVVSEFKERLLTVLGPDADFRIVYHFAFHRHVFDADPRFRVESFRTKTFHPSVVIRRAANPHTDNEVLNV